MTPAGEYWFKASDDILGRMSVAVSEYQKTFRQSSVVLRLGATPVLRGRFTAAAARIARSAPGFSKFELVSDVNPASSVEQVRMHQINFAIVFEESIQDDQISFAVSRLFEDQMAWAIPASVSQDDIRAALNTTDHPAKTHPILTSYVELDPLVPAHTASDAWYRYYMPYATPSFSTQTFFASIDLMASELGTCHVPISLLPNLNRSLLNEVKLHRVDGMNKVIVLAMRKNLLTLPACAHFFTELSAYCRNEYQQTIRENLIPVSETCCNLSR